MPGPFLVTGASGFAGRHLLQARKPDTAAIALVRDPAAWAGSDWSARLENVVPVQGSLTNIDDWAGGLPPLAGIFHFAALVRHSRMDADEVYAANVEGSLNIVRLAARHRCRVVMLTTSGVVGCFDTPSGTADENADYCEAAIADWPYYHSKLLAEREGRRLASELGVDLVFIRPPVLLGPEDHRFRSTSNILRMLRGRLPFQVRGGMHFADVRDVVQATWTAMNLPRARPVYHVPGLSTTLEEFFALVARVSGASPPRFTLPLWLARGIARSDERIGTWLRGRPLQLFPGPVVVEMASRYWGLQSLFAAEDLGYAPRDPLVTLRDTVDWLRANHESFR